MNRWGWRSADADGSLAHIPGAALKARDRDDNEANRHLRGTRPARAIPGGLLLAASRNPTSRQPPPLRKALRFGFLCSALDEESRVDGQLQAGHQRVCLRGHPYSFLKIGIMRVGHAR